MKEVFKEEPETVIKSFNMFLDKKSFNYNWCLLRVNQLQEERALIKKHKREIKKLDKTFY